MTPKHRVVYNDPKFHRVNDRRPAWQAHSRSHLARQCITHTLLPDILSCGCWQASRLSLSTPLAPLSQRVKVPLPKPTGDEPESESVKKPRRYNGHMISFYS